MTISSVPNPFLLRESFPQYAERIAEGPNQGSRTHFPTLAPVLFLDLDGVMADFDGDFPRKFGFDHREAPDAVMWETIEEHGSFFRDMSMCEGAQAFYRSIEHLSPVILTACPSRNDDKFADIAAQKREWVREHLGYTVPIIFAPGGKAKQLYMHRPGDILIDDFARNIERWNGAGGRGIWHTGDFAATRVLLDHHLGGTYFPSET